MWELSFLAFLISLGFGAAIVMARKTKLPKITVVQSQAQEINLEELATRVAKAVAKEVAEEVLKKLPAGGFNIVHNADGDLSIKMDESIIPIALETAITETNLEGAVKEEKAVDKDLDSAKSKLAGMLKNRKKKG